MPVGAVPRPKARFGRRKEIGENEVRQGYDPLVRWSSVHGQILNMQSLDPWVDLERIQTRCCGSGTARFSLISPSFARRSFQGLDDNRAA